MRASSEVQRDLDSQWLSVFLLLVLELVLGVGAAASLTRFRVPMEAWRRRQRFRDNEKRNSLFTDVIFESFEGTKMSFSFEAHWARAFYIYLKLGHHLSFFNLTTEPHLSPASGWKSWSGNLKFHSNSPAWMKACPSFSNVGLGELTFWLYVAFTSLDSCIGLGWQTAYYVSSWTSLTSRSTGFQKVELNEALSGVKKHNVRWQNLSWMKDVLF